MAPQSLQFPNCCKGDRQEFEVGMSDEKLSVILWIDKLNNIWPDISVMNFNRVGICSRDVRGKVVFIFWNDGQSGQLFASWSAIWLLKWTPPGGMVDMTQHYLPPKYQPNSLQTAEKLHFVEWLTHWQISFRFYIQIFLPAAINHRVSGLTIVNVLLLRLHSVNIGSRWFRLYKVSLQMEGIDSMTMY